MEFRLLGPLEVVDGATSLPIAARKQRALLAVLLLNANRTVSRERIVDDLWGETVPDSARKMVQIYVSQLRKVLPEPRLHTRPPGYALELADGELDLDRFERLVADGRAALTGGRAVDASDLIRRALALWRGPALAEFSEPFAHPEAARLEELRLTALEWRIEADLAVGRDAEVVGELEALVPRHPLRERLRSQQMLALYRAGRQAEALASYQSFRRALADELGIDPSAALKDLERRMLVQDPGLERPATDGDAVAPSAVPTAVPRASHTELIGREAELAEVGAFLSAGSPTALVLVGGPGIGKTSLWEAGVDGARDRGLRVLAARPTDAEAQHSFATLIDLLDGVASTELGGLPAPQLHALEVALLRAAPTGPPPEGPAISVGFLGALRALAARQPVLVAIDDVQWLDRPSADALAYAARRLDGVAVRFLLAARPEGQPALEAALGPTGLARLEVEPLSMGALRRVLAERLGLDLPRKLVRRIADTTLGNPLFALEVGRTLAEGGPLDAGDDLPLPDSVEELLGTRVARLPPQVQQAPARRRAHGRSTAPAAHRRGGHGGARRRRGRRRGRSSTATASAPRIHWLPRLRSSDRARATGASSTRRSRSRPRTTSSACSTWRSPPSCRTPSSRAGWRPRPATRPHAAAPPRTPSSSASTRCGSRRPTRRSGSSACSSSAGTSRSRPRGSA